MYQQREAEYWKELKTAEGRTSKWRSRRNAKRTLFYTGARYMAYSCQILGWRLWTRRSCRPSSAPIVRHCYVRCSTNQHSSWRSGISSCWTTTVEQQPAVQPTTVWP